MINQKEELASPFGMTNMNSTNKEKSTGKFLKEENQEPKD